MAVGSTYDDRISSWLSIEDKRLLVFGCRMLTVVDYRVLQSVVVSGYWLSVIGLLVVDFLCSFSHIISLNSE